MSRNDVIFLPIWRGDTCDCWPHCCRSRGTAGSGRWEEASRSRLWRTSSGKGLRLTSGGRSAVDYRLLRVENRRKPKLYKPDWRILDRRCIPFRAGLTDAVFGERHVPLWRRKLLLPLGTAAVAQFWHRAAGQQFGQQRGAPVLELSIYCQSTRVTNTSGSEAEGGVTTFKWRLKENSHLCFCTGLVFGMLVRG